MKTFNNGTLIKRGDRWALVIGWVDENGKRGQKVRRTNIACDKDTERHQGKSVKATGKGAAQARAQLAEFRKQLVDAEDAKRITTEITLSEYVEHYIDMREASGSIEPSTVHDYRKAAQHQLYKGGKHAIKDIALSDLTPQKIQAYEAWLLAPKPRGYGYHPVSVIKGHRLLSSALKQAVADGLIASNPMQHVKPPKKRRSAPNALTASDVAKLNAELAKRPLNTTIVAAKLAIYTGMRRGEICGLRWQDVDFYNAQLTVARAVGFSDNGSYLKATKTDVIRTVPIPSSLVAVLQEWRKQFDDIAEAGGLANVDRLYVLGDLFGNYKSPQSISKRWGDLAEELDLIGTEGRRVTFHDLRHTFATVAIAGGVDVKTVSSILGHANAAITLNVYASADPSAKRRAAAQIDALLG